MARIINNKTEYTPAPEPPSRQSSPPGIVFAVIGIALLIAAAAVRSGALVIGAFCCLVVGLGLLLRRSIGKQPGAGAIERAGEIGEEIAEELLESLPDEYTVLRNTTLFFDGKCAETDNIVIGKTGVFLIEVKNAYGYITCEQDTWKIVKQTQHNTYQKDMRNPVKQVGFQRWLLSGILKENALSTYIEAIVFFSHEDAHVLVHGDTKDVRIFTYAQSEQMIQYILSREQSLSAKKVQRLVQQLCPKA